MLALVGPALPTVCTSTFPLLCLQPGTIMLAWRHSPCAVHMLGASFTTAADLRP